MTSSKSLSILISKRSGAHRAGEPRGTWKRSSGMTPRISRLDPEQARIVGALRHREDAGGIGAQHDLGRDHGRADGHGTGLHARMGARAARRVKRTPRHSRASEAQSRESRAGRIASPARDGRLKPDHDAGIRESLSLAVPAHAAGGEELLQPVDVVVAVLDVRVAHQRAEQRQGRVDAVDDELVERAAQAHQAFGPVAAMDDQLADQRIVMRRDR